MTPVIPNQFHFIFGLRERPEPFHLVHYLCLASCIALNRPDRVFFYCGHEPRGRYWDRIRPHLTVERVEPVPFVAAQRYHGSMAQFRYAHHADFLRLDRLIERGGIYADIDTLFLRAYPSALRTHPFVIGREPAIRDPKTGRLTPSLCNAVLMAVPGAAFARRWREGMEAAFDGSWSNHSTLLPQRLAAAHPDELHIEPVSSFYPVPGTSVGLHALFEDDRRFEPESYSIHLWAHLWWSDRRVDFTTFHAGLLTETFVREVDTTYNVAARAFLPPPRLPRVLRRAVHAGERVLHGAGERVRWARENAGALAKLAVCAVAPQRLLPRREIHREDAWRQLEYARIRGRFTIRSGFEDAILAAIVRWDEYGMRQRRFAPGDVVLDIGAHTGAFTEVAWRRGSRALHAWEPEPGNFALLRRHVGGRPGVTLHSRAVFRSDAAAPRTLPHSGYVGANTGAGNVIGAGRRVSVMDQQVWDVASVTHEVGAVALDEILEGFERVRLIKLDCEGSEFPILLTSRLLGRVEEIIGEYHEVHPPLMAELAPGARLAGVPAWTAELLVERLTAAGFTVKLRPTAGTMGFFHAVRAPAPAPGGPHRRNRAGRTP